MNLATFLIRNALVAPDTPAICFGSHVYRTHATLADRVSRLAQALCTKFNLLPGDRVAIVSKNRPEYLEVLYAAWHAGLVAVPINAKLHSNEIRYILEDVGTGICFFSPDNAAAMYEATNGLPITAIDVASADYDALFRHNPAPVTPRESDHIAWIFYTSGTTGKPKGAMLTNRNLLAMSACCLLDVDSKPPWNTLLHVAPMSHGSGLYAIPYTMRGGTHVVPESNGFDVAETYKLIEVWPDVSFFAAPTIVNRLAAYEQDADTQNLKAIVYGGAPMLVEDCIRALDRFGPKLVQLYGQGESPMTITALSFDEHANRNAPNWRSRLGSVGRPQSLVDVMIADGDDKALPTGEIGEILVRGDTVMAGYWNREDASAQTLRNGWLHTGDMGVFDDEGYLTLKDRSKDLIISGGHNIYPREIEEVLLQHQDVAEVSVIGRADPEWGETVVACIVTNTGGEISTSDLNDFCMARIARFKRPRRYRFLESLPKNNYGKVVKNDLRRMDQALD